MKFLYALFLLLPAIAHAQIYADFTVRHGAQPLGTFRARLDFDKAPRTCANFIGLATGKRPWIDVRNGTTRINTPYYNGLTFHRLIHDFVIQGGSPNGNGTDGPGYNTVDEYHPALRHSGRYLLSMAKSSQPNTNGSQFFITLEATPSLDDKHSIFGEVISGKEIIDSFTQSSLFPTNAERPITPIVMESVVITGPDAESFDLMSPALRLPSVGTVSITTSRDVAAGSFTMTFDRTARSNYQIFYSTDLSSWTPFRHSINFQPVAALPFVTTGVDMPEFFMSVAPVSYENIPDAPANLTASGKTLTLGTRSGHQITMIFDGGTGGTWTDDQGGSGTLSSVQWTDYAPTTGNFTLESSATNQLPIGLLRAIFSSPAGPAGLTSLQAYVSFHTPVSGQLEEYQPADPLNPTKMRPTFVWGP